MDEYLCLVLSLIVTGLLFLTGHRSQEVVTFFFTHSSCLSVLEGIDGDHDSRLVIPKTAAGTGDDPHQGCHRLNIQHTLLILFCFISLRLKTKNKRWKSRKTWILEKKERERESKRHFVVQYPNNIRIHLLQMQTREVKEGGRQAKEDLGKN